MKTQLRWLHFSIVLWSLAPGRWEALVRGVEIQVVQLGGNATISCGLWYHYETMWLRHQPDGAPTLILLASLRDAKVIEMQNYRPRFGVEVENRSLALRVHGIEQEDLGFYYCLGKVKEDMTIRSGAQLKVSDSHIESSGKISTSNSSVASTIQPVGQPGVFVHVYAGVVGLGLILMVMSVFITHHRTSPPRSHRKQ